MADQESAWHVDIYTSRSDAPMRRFMAGLVGRERADAAALIKMVEARGNQLREPHSKQVEAGLWELRRYQVRIFYVFRPGRRLVLLDGIVKKQDKIPAQTLTHIRGLVKDLMAQETKAQRGPYGQSRTGGNRARMRRHE